MSQEERDTWNERYRDDSRGARGPEAFLVRAYEDFIAPLFPHGGTAIDIAGGTGRHSLYLAGQGTGGATCAKASIGWRVTLADISEIGIARAQAEAARLGLTMDYVCADARTIDFGRNRFDLVICFFYLERDILPRLAQALRPGGMIVYKTYTHEHERFAERGTTHPEYFLQDNELLHAFPGFRVLHYEETVREPGSAELVARKR